MQYLIAATPKYIFRIAIILILTTGLSLNETFSQINTVNTNEIKAYPLIGDANPEGITIDQRNGHIYTGSMKNGTMQITFEGKSKYFIQADSSILLPNVLGSSIDETNNRIWVCSNDFSLAFKGTPKARVSIIDLASGHLIKKFDETDLAVAKDIYAVVNDIVLDKLGNAYISNSASPAIFRISDDLKEVKVLTSNFPQPPTGKKYSLNGIEIADDQQHLIVNTYILNEKEVAALFKVNINSGEVVLIPFDEKGTMDFSTSGGDGLLSINRNTFLCLTISGALIKIELNKDWSKAVIVNISQGTRAQGVLAGCATLAYYKDKIYTSNAQGISVLNPNVKPNLPYVIIEIPKSILGL